jgi:hypothetical protein
MSDIFISYASEDRPKAKTLAEVLTRQGWSIWWDRRIPVGETFGRVIEKQIRAAKCVIVLWSKAALESDWVQNEASEGMQRGLLAPVFIEDVRPPFEFRLIQAARLVDWDGSADDIEFIGLLDALNRIIGRGESLVQEQPAAEAGRREHENAEAGEKKHITRDEAQTGQPEHEKAAADERANKAWRDMQERLARAKVEAERRHREGAEAGERERKAREQAESERQVPEKAQAERQAREKEEAERKNVVLRAVRKLRLDKRVIAIVALALFVGFLLLLSQNFEPASTSPPPSVAQAPSIVAQGYLGVSIQELTPSLAKSFGLASPMGALVTEVNSESAASREGILRGDIIVKFDGQAVNQLDDIRHMVAQAPVGKTIPIEVFRDGKRIALDAIIEERRGKQLVSNSQGASPEPNCNDDSNSPEDIWGLTVQNLTPETIPEIAQLRVQQGVIIRSCKPDSPGSTAGLRPGDIILELDNIEVASVEKLEAAAKSVQKEKKSARVLIRREHHSAYVMINSEG